METIIRRVVMDDAETLSALGKRTFYDTFTGTCSEEDMQTFLEEYFNLQQVQSELINSNDYYFFAEMDGVAVGYLRLMEDHKSLPPVNQWNALELKRIYVDKEFHGKGIAALLMDFTLQFALNNKYDVVFLGVWEHNTRAQKFYSKFGFEYSGYTHDFPIGNTPQTDIWLWKFL